jgi:F5/8 type C domain
MSFPLGVIAGFPFSPAVEPPPDGELEPVSALYWRVRFPWPNDGLGYIFNEIEMRATEGGADQCQGGTPSAYGGSNVDNLFDGNTSTSWMTSSFDGTYNGWVQYQFAAPVQVTEIAITCDNTNQYTASVIALDYSSDGVNWTMWANWFDPAPWGEFETRVFSAANRKVIPAGTSPFWRLNVSANNGYANLELTEIEYRETPGGPSATLTETISTSRPAGFRLLERRLALRRQWQHGELRRDLGVQPPRLDRRPVLRLPCVRGSRHQEPEPHRRPERVHL